MDCPNCKQELSETDIAPEAALARCPNCDRAFTLEKKSGAGGRPPSPDGWQVFDDGETLVIEHHWPSMTGGVVAGFGLFWNGVLAVMAGALFGNSTPTLVKVIFGATLVLFGGIGIAVLYTALAYCVNSTRYEIDDGEIRVEYGPLYWPGGGVHGTSRIEQLYCKKIKHDRKQWYRVRAIDENGSEEQITGRLNRHAALFLERVLEDQLGITDREVGGEVNVHWDAMKADAGPTVAGRLRCEHCNHPLSAGDVEIDEATGTCGACGRKLEDSKDGAKPPGEASTSPEVKDWKPGNVPLPEGWNLEENASRLTVTHAWNSAIGLVQCIFSLFWFAFVALIIFLAEPFEPATLYERTELFMGLSLPAVIGLGLLYAGIAHFVNKTTIQADSNELIIQYGPMPWWGQHRFAVEDIERLRCEEDEVTRDGDVHYVYRVVVVLSDGNSVECYSSPKENAALYLRDNIMELLKREKQPVGGTDQPLE